MIRVLVVEDSPTVRRMLIGFLDEANGIEVVGQAENGRQAVKMAWLLNPDLITMDVEMPDMNGLEATKRIMGSKPSRILIVTAHADSPELNIAFEAMKAGALDVVTKPGGMGEGDRDAWEHEFISKIRSLAEIPVPGLPAQG